MTTTQMLAKVVQRIILIALVAVVVWFGLGFMWKHGFAGFLAACALLGLALIAS